MSEPRRAWRIELDLQADSYEELCRALEQVALDLLLNPDDQASRRMCTGGCARGWTAHVTHEPEWDHDRYAAAIKAEVTRIRAKRAEVTP